MSSCTDCVVVFAWLYILNFEKGSVAGCDIWFSQHRWHTSKYGVFLMEAVIYSFQRGRRTLHLQFMPYIEGNANSEVLLVTHIPWRFTISSLSVISMMGKQVQGVTVTSWINTSSMGPYTLGLVKVLFKRNVYKWNRTCCWPTYYLIVHLKMWLILFNTI